MITEYEVRCTSDQIACNLWLWYLAGLASWPDMQYNTQSRAGSINIQYRLVSTVPKHESEGNGT